MLNIPQEQLEEFKGPVFDSKESTYPKEVILKASYMTHLFSDQLEEDEVRPQDFFEEICIVFIDCFLEQGSDFSFTSEAIHRAHAKSFIRTAIEDLRDEGIIDSIENKDGEDLIFLTEKGKKYYKRNKLDE
jgi:hypothetical protein